jgi:hypothetical protein
MTTTLDEESKTSPAQPQIGQAPQIGRAIVTMFNVVSVLPLAVVSSFGWFLLLIGIADQGNTAGAYASGGVTLFLPWLIWLGSVIASQWLWPRARALACIVAALPMVAEIALFMHFR